MQFITCFCLPVLLSALTWLPVSPAAAQSPGSMKSVPISFLPPPLENASYSLGIYEAKSGKLIRRLHEAAIESAFTAGLNGLITKWDGKNDAGKPVPPGRYAARGYAVGPLVVTGVGILGNDWTDEDDLRIRRVQAVALVPEDGGLAVLASLADDSFVLLRFSAEGKLLWGKPVGGLTKESEPWLKITATNIAVMPRFPAPDGTDVINVANYRVKNGSASDELFEVSTKEVPFLGLPETAVIIRPVPSPDAFAPVLSKPDLSLATKIATEPPGRNEKYLPSSRAERVQRSLGKGNTFWVAAGLNGLLQTAPDGEVLRRLEPAPGEPLPYSVSASANQDRLYLLEERKGWQRVRGLSWVETKEENGKAVSTWQTFYERNIRRPEAILDQGDTARPIEIDLVENPLDPGKAQQIKLSGAFDDKGSYLATADGLCLRRISQSANLKSVKLEKGSGANGLTFYQSDGAAWDEFSITGANKLMSFDAGEWEMTANGEKPIDTKAAEPPDL